MLLPVRRRISDTDGESRGMQVQTLAQSRISAEAQWSDGNTHFTLPVESQITKRLGSLEGFFFFFKLPLWEMFYKFMRRVTTCLCLSDGLG